MSGLARLSSSMLMLQASANVAQVSPGSGLILKSQLPAAEARFAGEASVCEAEAISASAHDNCCWERMMSFFGSLCEKVR
jgi:hypothetical protein